MSIPVTVYSLPNCPNCELLKHHLKENGVTFDEQSLENPDNVVSIQWKSRIVVREAPILKIGPNFYESAQIFDKGARNVIIPIPAE